MPAKCDMYLDHYSVTGIWLNCRTHRGEWNMGDRPTLDEVNDMVEQHTQAVTKSEG